MPENEYLQATKGSQEQPIAIDDEIDIPQSKIGVEVRDLRDRVQHCDPLPALPTRPIKAEEEDDDLSEDPWAEDEADYDKANEAIEAIDLTVDLEPEPVKVSVSPGHCKHWKRGIRNPCRCGTHYTATHASTPDVEFRTMHLVELKEPVAVGRYQAEFLEVIQIFFPKNKEKDNAFVRGFPYARTRNLDGRIEPRKNELCALLEIDTNDERSSDIQALFEIPLEGIKAARILHKTNKLFPECRFDPVSYQTREDREAKAPLTCRWVMTSMYPDARYRRAWRAVDGEELRHFNEADVIRDRHRASDADRLTQWRKVEKLPGGSYIPRGPQDTKVEPTSETNPAKILPGQKYTVVDIFSGAGGFSKGVEMAGFKVLIACDHWSHCCGTYRENFPDTELHERDVHEFISERRNDTDLTVDGPGPVDFVHMSPPCQFYSPAHTCPGKNDSANIATLFSCEEVIRIFRPRLFTVEQTFGLAQARHSSYFNAFIQGFTRHGYSVRWKVLHLVEFGLPQTRRRLLMMGAAPGEPLPGWPEPTHSRAAAAAGEQTNRGGHRLRRRPPVSAAQACGALVPGRDGLHDVAGARAVDRPPWDGDRPLERTITTSGGQCYHWSGLRELTLAEFAALQGFPADFRFRPKCIKKQIGNAFPPVVVKAIMKQVRRHLEEVDGCQRLPDPGSVVVLGDDGDEGDEKHQPVQWLKHEDNAYQDISGIYDEKRAIAVATRNSQPEARAQSGRAPGSLSGMFLRDIRSLSIEDDFKAAMQSNWDATTTTPRGSEPQPQPPTPADRRRSSAESITYVGESSRAGSSRQLPVIVEDSEPEPEAQAGTVDPRVPGPGFCRGGGRDAELWREYVGDLDEDVAMIIAIQVSAHEAGSRLGGERVTGTVQDSSSADDPIGCESRGKAKAKCVEVDGCNDGQGLTDYQGAHGDDAEELQLAFSKSSEGQGQEEIDPKGKGKGKEVVRTFAQYDAGQDNESPKGSKGEPKRSRTAALTTGTKGMSAGRKS